MNYVRSVVEKLGIEVVSERENGEAMARCPFHADLRASFSINMNTGLWNCFAGCGGGTVQSLLSKMGRSYMHVDVTRQHEFSSALSARKKDCRPIEMKDISGYPLALDNVFLQRRGLDNTDVTYWGLRDTGLGILIPIFNIKDVLVGSAVRMKVEDKGHKYSYNLGFKRNQVLFGIHKLRLSYKAIVVEGLFDAIVMHKHGHRDTVALLGTSMSESQVEILLNLGISEIILLLDNDRAGIEATSSIADRLIHHFSVRVPDYGIYKSGDPADMTEKESDSMIASSRSYLKCKLEGGITVCDPVIS